MKQKILFITRNYPPKIGGLEAYSYNLIKEFEKYDTVFKIVSTQSNLHLVWFLPFSYFSALFTSWRHSVRNIHLCDGLLAPLGVLLKPSTRAKVTISIHGLDITYGNPLYQGLIPRCVSGLDKIICVSRFTRDECIRRGIPQRKCRVIPNGINPGELYLGPGFEALRSRLEEIVGISLGDKVVLITVGRLVKRKGVAWFIEHVVPRLEQRYCYIVGGQGPEYDNIQSKIRHADVQNRVFMLGRISEEIRRLLYNAADIFVMPNITVGNDIEGFGISLLEAGSCGLPVVASNLQGIKDAVVEGRTGVLVEEGDVQGFILAIRKMDLKREDVRLCVNERFNWPEIYKHYHSAILK
ncbi:MAG: glycosyltransferase family 4 protein [Desulfobacterales bacterium]|jgi:glycosyltransferase involved in cell wall biosynthesis